MREPRRYATYIMASRSRVLYTGMTNDIVVRTRQHKSRQADGFTNEHRCTRLVWYQIFDSPSAAIAREKQIKRWRRSKKVAIIEENNPFWHDLSEEWGKPIIYPFPHLLWKSCQPLRKSWTLIPQRLRPKIAGRKPVEIRHNGLIE